MGHVIQWGAFGEAGRFIGLYERIYSFHMPSFIFISGFLTYNREHFKGGFTNSLKQMCQKIGGLIVPYFVWGFILEGGFITPGKCLWYVWSLAVYVAVYYCVGFIASKHIKYFDKLLAGLCFLLFCFSSLKGVSILGARSSLLPFFLLGVLARRYEISFMRLCRSKWVVPTSLILGLILLIGYESHQEVSIAGHSFSGISVNAYRLLLAVSVTLALCCITINFLNEPFWSYPFICIAAKVTLAIYAFHYIPVRVFCPKIQLTSASLIGQTGAYFLLSLGVGVMLSRIPVLSYLTIGIKRIKST